MNNPFISVLALVSVGIFIGIVIGMNIIAAAIRKFIANGDMDIYVKGRRCETFELW